MIKLYSKDFVDEAGGQEIAIFDSPEHGIVEGAGKADESEQDLSDEIDFYGMNKKKPEEQDEEPDEDKGGESFITTEDKELVKSTIVSAEEISREKNDDGTVTITYLVTIEDLYRITRTTVDMATGEVVDTRVSYVTEEREEEVQVTESEAEPDDSEKDPDSETSTGDY